MNMVASPNIYEVISLIVYKNVCLFSTCGMQIQIILYMLVYQLWGKSITLTLW